jgi:hypothetical protein
MSESGIGSVRTRGSFGEACTKYQRRCRSRMLWYMFTSAFMISPVRGSTTCPPVALATV